jgi:hypothetical protein
VARVVTRIAAGPGAQTPDGAEQFVGVLSGADLTRRRGGFEELTAHGDQPVDEVGVQRLEAGVVGPQRCRQAVLGDQEVDEHADPAG